MGMDNQGGGHHSESGEFSPVLTRAANTIPALAGAAGGRAHTNCGVNHDRNENAACNLLKLALLAVGEDVMLLDGGALASGDPTAGETAPDEGRTKPVGRV